MSENVRIQENITILPSFRHFTTIITLTNNRTHTLRTTVTATETVVDWWIRNNVRFFSYNHMNDIFTVGINVQWTRNGDGLLLPATLELCCGDKCLIFLVQHSSFTPIDLLDFLSDPRITFVSLTSFYNASHFRDSCHGMRIMRRNMPIIVGKPDNLSLNQSVEVHHGWWSDEIDRSNWFVRLNEISLDQVRQATMMPYVASSFGLRNEIWRMNPSLGPWARCWFR